MRCLGLNRYGQVGVTSADDHIPRPLDVEGLAGVRIAVATSFSTLTLHADGSVRAWGGACSNSLGTAPPPDQCTDGACVRRPRPLPELTDIQSIVANEHGACALRGVDRTVWCWGATPGLARGVEVTPTRVDSHGDVRQIVLQGDRFMVRRLDGTIETGNPRSDEPLVVPPGWEIASGGSSHVCALLPDGSARCWGDNRYGQIGNGERGAHESVPRPAGVDCVRTLARGDAYTCAIRTDRTVWCWGDNVHEQTGIPSEDSDDCGASGRRRACVLRPRQVPGLDEVEAIFLGGGSACAVRADGDVWCWGDRAGGVRAAPEWTTRVDQ